MNIYLNKALQMKQFNTFWKIIVDNEIVIPTIQRDYAYGRPEANNILNNLLLSIKKALDNENSDQLHLAFVYGKLEGKQNDQVLLRNSENIRALLESVKEYAGNLDIIVDVNTKQDVVRLADNVKFIPIDGQQRLTTLFLLHWYLAIHLKKRDDVKILEKFQYATRVSSKEFCELLCAIDPKESPEINSEFITNQEGYFKQWYNDPTVKNMLRVINQINSVFKDSKSSFPDYYQKLTTTDTICFDFFDLDNFQLTDELYVKMNSRGKKLTQFENFKAWLYSEMEIDRPTKKKIDIDWYDMFWQAQVGEVSDIDTAYLQWFKNLFLADYIKEKSKVESSSLKNTTDLEQYQSSNANEKDDTASVIGILRKSESKFLDFIIRDKEARGLFLSKIDEYNCLLNNITSHYKSRLKFGINPEYYKGTIEQLLFTEQSNLNWWQATFLYASACFLGKQKVEQGIDDYFRVISNLIFNTPIDSPDLYLQAIKSVDEILEGMNIEGDILKYLSGKNIDEINFFRGTQKWEEKRKAQLCLDGINGSDWKKALVEAELHQYFYGQIGFILKISDAPLTLELFNENFRKISALFSEEVLSENSYLLFRCLLTQGDCFYHDNNNRTFNFNYRRTLRDRSENWRKFFEQKNDYINIIINHPKFDENNIIKSLNEIIDIEAPEIKSGYHSKFITNPKLLEYCKKHYIREYYGNYYLLNSTRLSGYFFELYTYNWYLKNINRIKVAYPAIEVSYRAGKGEQSEPYILIVKEQTEWRIYKDYRIGKYKLKENELETDDVFEKIKDAFNKVLIPEYAELN